MNQTRKEMRRREDWTKMRVIKMRLLLKDRMTATTAWWSFFSFYLSPTTHYGDSFRKHSSGFRKHSSGCSNIQVQQVQHPLLGSLSICSFWLSLTLLPTWFAPGKYIKIKIGLFCCSKNIARGTTDPGYWLFNLSYLSSSIECHQHWFQIWPTCNAISIGSNFGH